MENGASVWHCSNTGSWKRLEAAQRVLAIAINAFQNSSREAMEVTTGVPPIDIRYSDIAVRDDSKEPGKASKRPTEANASAATGREFVGPVSSTTA